MIAKSWRRDGDYHNNAANGDSTNAASLLQMTSARNVSHNFSTVSSSLRFRSIFLFKQCTNEAQVQIVVKYFSRQYILNGRYFNYVSECLGYFSLPLLLLSQKPTQVYFNLPKSSLHHEYSRNGVLPLADNCTFSHLHIISHSSCI